MSEIPSAVSVKSGIVGDMVPCSVVEIHQHLRGT
jgi:hypothetical protein